MNRWECICCDSNGACVCWSDEEPIDCPIGNIPVWVNTFDFRTRGY